MQTPANSQKAVPVLLFAVTIFLSAFLLFEVQPIVGKIILPWFGGSAAVWTTCILFFQLLLLAGYLYADLTSRLAPRLQGLLHAVLLLLALLTLPLSPSASLAQANDTAPELRIALVLGMSVGLPYFLLSTTGPLLQAWYAREQKEALPYRLYALSNFGSMLALLTYPFLVEPNFLLGVQTHAWSWGFGVFAVLCAALSLGNLRHTVIEATVQTDEPVTAPSLRLSLLWAALAACPSVLLLAVTSHLTQNIAPIPFLWVLPLALYLLSFILCFEGRGWYMRGPYVLLLAICIALVCVAVLEGPSHPEIWRLISLYAATLFFACMVCHGELAALKPHPRFLTRFYLMLSVGGALGGIFVALIAPHLFRDNYELPLGIVFVVIMIILVLVRDPESLMYRNDAKKLPPLIVATLAAAGIFLWLSHAEWLLSRLHPLFEQLLPDSFVTSAKGGLPLALAIGIVVATVLGALYLRFLTRSRVSLSGKLIAVAMISLFVVTVSLGDGYAESASEARVMLRNFYGWLKVEDSGSGSSAERMLTHGTITHGMQYLTPDRKRWPTTYYGRNSGAGLAVTELGLSGPVKVGVVGLGTGTFAAYARKGDSFRFYDINPQVLVLATTEFSYLQDAGADGATVEVALGDARLSMAAEPPQKFDLLVLDAFSSDAIPVHLLTREAFALYFRHLSPRGVLAVHISNRYLDLKPVVKEAAQYLGKEARLVDSEEIDYIGVYSSDWILVAQDPKIFEAESLKLAAEQFDTKPIRMWTDDFSDLYQILK